MDSVIRAISIYLFLLVVLRLAGKKTLAEATTFDFVLLLIISEATQQAMLGKDQSFINAVIVIITLIFSDITLTVVKNRSTFLERLLEGTPLLLIENGELKKDRLKKSQVDEQDILQQARQFWGLERLDQIKYAILEKSGGITIVPKPEYR